MTPVEGPRRLGRPCCAFLKQRRSCTEEQTVMVTGVFICTQPVVALHAPKS